MLGEDTAPWPSANQTPNMLTSLSGAAQCPELEKRVLLFTNYVVCGITFQLLPQVPRLLMAAGDWIQVLMLVQQMFYQPNHRLSPVLFSFNLNSTKKKKRRYLSFWIWHNSLNIAIPPSVHIFPSMSRLLTTAKDNVWVPFKLLLLPYCLGNNKQKQVWTYLAQMHAFSKHLLTYSCSNQRMWTHMQADTTDPGTPQICRAQFTLLHLYYVYYEVLIKYIILWRSIEEPSPFHFFLPSPAPSVTLIHGQ